MEAAWYNSVLFAALALHAWAKPYKQASTNVMGVVSLVALMAGYNSIIEPEKAVEWVYWVVLVMDTVTVDLSRRRRSLRLMLTLHVL